MLFTPLCSVQENVSAAMELLQCFPASLGLVEVVLPAPLSPGDEDEDRPVMCGLHLQEPPRP